MTYNSTTEETFPQYNVAIIGRHIDITDSIKNYILERVSKLTRFSKRILEIHVTIEVQKIEHRTDFVLRGGNHLSIKAQAISEDMYASIDKAASRLERQLRRYERRLREHDAKAVYEVDLQVNVLRPTDEEEVSDDIEEQNLRDVIERYSFHEVAETETTPLTTLRVDEAIMKLELSGDQFRIFRCEEDQKIKVLYRRKDGAFGLVQIEGNV